MDFVTFNKVKKIVKFNSRYSQNKLGGVNLLENAKKTVPYGKVEYLEENSPGQARIMV